MYWLMHLSIIYLIFLLFLITPAYAQLSDKTGLLQNYEINTGGYAFDVIVTSNLDIKNVLFDADSKSIIFDVHSSIDENLAEIVIPADLISGNLTILLDDKEIYPLVQQTDGFSLIVLEFSQIGQHTIIIMGTTYLPEFEHLLLLFGTALVCSLYIFRNHSFKIDSTLDANVS